MNSLAAVNQRVFAIAVALMALTFALSGVFALASFDGFYRDVLLSRYHVVAQGLKVNLERAASYGIDLGTTRGVSRDLERALDLLATGESVGPSRGAPGTRPFSRNGEALPPGSRPSLADAESRKSAQPGGGRDVQSSSAGAQPQLVVEYLRTYTDLGLGANTSSSRRNRSGTGRGRGSFKPAVPSGPLYVLLTSPQGEVLHRTSSPGSSASTFDDDNAVLEGLAEAVSLPNGPGESAASTRHLKLSGHYYFPLKIHDQNGDWTASIVVATESAPLDRQADATIEKTISGMVLTLMLMLLVYTVVAGITLTGGRAWQGFQKRRLLIISIVVGAVGQLAAGAVAGLPYKDAYLAATVDKAQVLSSLAKRDIEAALARGLSLESLNYKHYPWRTVLEGYRDLASIEVRDNSGTLVSVTQRESVLGPIELAEPDVDVPIDEAPDYHAAEIPIDGDDSEVGSVVTRMSLDSVNGRIADLIADGLTAIGVTLLILVECLLLFLLFFEHRAASAAGAATAQPPVHTYMRPVAFIFLFGVDLAMSFVPLHMEIISGPLLGIPHDLVLALPVSAEFLFVGLSMLVAGSWLDRHGWRRPFLAGISFAVAGSLYSWLATDPIHFIASRGLLGVGYGLTVMACQGCVASNSDTKRRAYTLAQLFAGIYAGSLCGGVTGALLAERLGFQSVFLAGVLMLVFVLGIVLLAMRPSRATVAAAGATDTAETTETAHAQTADASTPESPSKQYSVKALREFMRNPVVLALVLLSSLPASIAAVGFLNYFSPIYLNRAGASQSTIGQVLMLYGLILWLVGPMVSKYLDTIGRKRIAIVIGCVLGGYALFVFDVVGGVSAAIIAVVLLGLSHSLMLSAQSAYLLTLDAARQLGEGKALAVFRSTSRFGQMLGPIVFGWIALGDSAFSLKHLGIVYAVLAVGFWFLTRPPKTSVPKPEPVARSTSVETDIATATWTGGI